MANLKLTKDFKEFLSLLNSARIEYLLIGGYAVALYGHVRHTKDIDIWVKPDPATTTALIDVLVAFGFSRASLEREPLFNEKQTVLRMGNPPDRIEILSKISGCDFAASYPRREVAQIDDVQIPVISLDDLLANKLASGRAKDLADVEVLSKAKRPMDKG
jgi:hypothetical protein